MMSYYRKVNPALILDKAFKIALFKVGEQYKTLLGWRELDIFKSREDINIKPSSRDEMTKFFLSKQVKIMEGETLIWNPDFIKEYFGRHAKMYVAHIAKEIQSYKSNFEHFQERLSSGEFIEFLEKELKKTDLVLSTYEGRSYVKAKRSANELEHFERLLRFSNNEDVSLNLLGIDSPYRPALGMGFFPQVKLGSDMWLKIECAIVMDEVIRSFLKSIKRPIKIEKCPFDIDSPIFIDDGQDYLFHILMKSEIIAYDKQNKSVKKLPGFMGACKALFLELKRKEIIYSSATFVSFIKYLNETEGYNAGISQKSKGNIATKPTERNAWSRVEVEFSKIFGE